MKHDRTVLTTEQILEIYRLKNAGFRTCDVSRKLKKSDVTVHSCYTYVIQALNNELKPKYHSYKEAIKIIKRNNKPVQPELKIEFQPDPIKQFDQAKENYDSAMMDFINYMVQEKSKVIIAELQQIRADNEVLKKQLDERQSLAQKIYQRFGHPEIN